jgi:hypothetical protein
MQFSDFFNVGSGLGDTVKIVFFRMLPRGAQIEKVRAEINSGLLKKYGKMTKLEIDKENKTIGADLYLKGETEGVRKSRNSLTSPKIRPQAKLKLPTTEKTTWRLDCRKLLKSQKSRRGG